MGDNLLNRSPRSSEPRLFSLSQNLPGEETAIALRRLPPYVLPIEETLRILPPDSFQQRHPRQHTSQVSHLRRQKFKIQRGPGWSSRRNHW